MHSAAWACAFYTPWGLTSLCRGVGARNVCRNVVCCGGRHFLRGKLGLGGGGICDAHHCQQSSHSYSKQLLLLTLRGISPAHGAHRQGAPLCWHTQAAGMRVLCPLQPTTTTTTKAHTNTHPHLHTLRSKARCSPCVPPLPLFLASKS